MLTIIQPLLKKGMSEQVMFNKCLTFQSNVYSLLQTRLAIDAAMQDSSSEHDSLCNVLIDVLNKRTRQRQECVNR